MKSAWFTRMPKQLLQSVSLALVISCAAAWGQTITGDVTGIVTDQSGAIVQKATVSAKNIETGVVVSTVTNKDGIYSIRFLQIGEYQVTVEAPGFDKQIYPPFQLEQGATAKVDAKLSVGSLATTVDVQGSLPPLLATEDATTSTTFDANTIENITNKARNFSLFSALIPGAVNTSPQQLSGTFATERDTSQVDEVGANGNRAQGNNYILDGVEINETISQLIGFNPNLDALGEVKVISANPSAEYGNANGSIVTAVTKSGTNEFHGGAGFYLENYLLDANSWANKNHLPGQVIPISPYTQAIFTFELGGPVRIPWLFNGKNKLFFFVDYEGTRTHQGGIATASVLSLKERTGDFSELLDPNIMCGGTCSSQSKLIQLYDPTNNFAPFINNQIPISNPLVQFLIAHPTAMPLPNTTSAIGSPNSNNYEGSSKTTNRDDQADVKIDWTPTGKDRVSFRYLQGEGSDTERNPVLVNFPTPGDYPVKGFTANFVHTFNPHVVNEFLCCFFRTRYTNSKPLDLTGLFGMNGNAVVGIPGGQIVPGFSQQNFPDGGGVGTIGSQGGGTDNVENTFNYADTLTIQRGRHLFKMGVQFERYQQNFYNAAGGALGSFGFTGVFTSNPNIGAGSATVPSAAGWGAADWALDRVAVESYGGVTSYFGDRSWHDAYFFQDDWKILPNLTLNLGARYEYDQPMYEVHNREDNPQPGPNGVVTMLTAGVNGASRALYNPTYHDILPRLGVEYQFLPRAVFSVGYGISAQMEGTGTGNRLVQNAPFQYTFSLQATPPSKTSAGQFFQETKGFSTGAASYGTGYQSWTPRLQPEETQQYNVSLQFQVSRSAVLKVAYVGEKGAHLIEEYRGNELAQPCYVGGVLEPVSNSSCGVVDPSPFYSLVGETGSVITTDSDGDMSYNALQVQYRQHPWKGLEFTANYAYGKAMTDTTGFQAVSSVNGTGVAPEDTYDVPLNWGPAGQDERHTLNANMVYQFPFGRGGLFFSNVNHAVDEAIGGWKLSMVLSAYSGFPNTVGAATQNIQTYFNGAPQQRPNTVGQLPIGKRYELNGGIFWYGPQTAATIAQRYVQPGNTQYGDTKVGDLRGPGYQDYDFSLFKDFAIFREQTLGLEVDAYNAFNITSLGNPSTGAGSPTSFGEITSVRGASRTMQVAAKYRF